jgi:hypothetical protein
MTTEHYSFHGLNLSLSGRRPVLEALHSRLGRFPGGRPGEAWDARFEFVREGEAEAQAARRPGALGRSILDLGPHQALYFDGPEQLYLEVERRARAVCDLKTRQATIAYEAGEEAELWLLSHLFFTVPLAELLKRRGLYMAHMAGVAIGGQGLLLAGASGAGKTTLTLALLRGGFDFLADDTLFLARRAGLRALAFPDELDITAQTASFFPELGTWQPGGATRGPQKRPICATRVYGVAPCWECAPAVLLFPQPSGSGQSALAPMPKSEALLQLVCNVLRTEPLSSQAHLDVLAELVNRCRCCRLHTGRDFDALPGLMRRLLEEGPP